MAFLIRTIAIAKSGREIIRDRTVESAGLVIGRSPDSDIHLPDLSVELQHVSIADAGGGMIEAKALGELPFGLDGSNVTEGTIDPNAGAQITVGPAELALSRDGDGPVQIIISQSAKASGAADPVAGFALAKAMPSKRGMAWIGSLAVLILLLSVPIVTNLFSSPAPNNPYDRERVGATMFDAAWSAGDLSIKHHHLEDNCEACHVTPFVSVQDETCLTCHEELGLTDHSTMDKLRTGMPALSVGDGIQWTIAQGLGKEGPLGCVSCHSEHEGLVEAQAADQQFCADCHLDLDTRLTEAQVRNAHDFGEAHPSFRPMIYTAFSASEPERVLLKDKPVEESGLKFTHDDHMDEQGGVARMAISLEKYGQPLECSDCHSEWTEDERKAMLNGEMSNDAIGQLGTIDWSDNDLSALRKDGLTAARIQNLGDFKPVIMEDSCESCHSLVFDRAGPDFRILRHGDVDDLMADLATMDRGPRRAVVTGRGRPGQFARGGRYFTNFGRPMSAYIAINRALESTGVCGECHIPTMTEGRRDLTPVNLPDRFLIKGSFNHGHEDHEDIECSECHATSESGAATDLLIPDIAECRECHMGEAAVATEQITPSSCAVCHGYHTPTAPWKREDHPLDLPGNGSNDTVATILSSLRP